MPFKISFSGFFTYALIALPAVTFSQQAKISINAERILNQLPANIYGACIEDVNHEIYGGIYDQRIFGESFEEPAPGPIIHGWQSFGGIWQTDKGSLSVNAGEGYKLVRQQSPGSKYTVEVQMRFGRRKDNAGLLVNVNNANKGPDSFNGYEISLDPGKGVLVLGKHQFNWTPLQEIKLSIDFNDWIKIKVVNTGKLCKIYLNDSKDAVATLNDTNNLLPPGTIGLRTYNADVDYKHLVIIANGKTVNEEFIAKELPQVSSTWDAVNDFKAGDFLLDDKDAYNGRQAQVIVHNGGHGSIGVANSGLNRWGIALQKGHTYSGTVFLKGTGIAKGVTLSLQSADGKRTYSTHIIKDISNGWVSYPFALIPTQTDHNARFVISINSNGKLCADQVTLMCKKEQFKGLPLRASIAKAMQQEGLNFLRYGGTMVNASGYRWKKMLGPRAERPPYTGFWYPYSTNGFGIEDFLQFCEAAGFEAAFAINIEETPQDVADMVEYLKGDISTPWGKQRAVNGHPAPYKVKYIEIGNEEVIFHGDVAAEYDHYIERFNLLQNAMHAQDTTIKFVCSAWWRPVSPNMERVFRAINGKADYWDLHTDADDPHAGNKVDSSLSQMQAMFTSWDANTRLKCTIFEENGAHHDLARALGHASTLNAVRRHGNFVLTSCAANALQPLGQNDNGWDQGQVFFTPAQVWGMPPYYAQQMASSNHLPLNIEATATGDINISAAMSNDGKLLAVYIVNPSNKSCTAIINLQGFENRAANATIIQMAGKLVDVNTSAQPARVSPKTTNALFQHNNINYTLPAASYTIIRFNR